MRAATAGRGLCVAAALLIVSIFHAGCDRASGRGGVARVGAPAPALALPTLQGKTVRLEGLRGKIVLVNFWATWCGPCALEMPALEALYEEFRDREFEVLAVSVDAGEPFSVMAFAEERGLGYSVLHDPAAHAMTRWGVTVLPTTFLVGRDGTVVRRDEGYRDWRAPGARAEILALLNAQAPERRAATTPATASAQAAAQ